MLGGYFMKKCPMCGIDVSDHATECPECGCPIADTSSFALKGGPVRKRSGNSLGTTVSTGSGLTDILNEGQDDFSDIEGSIPISLSVKENDEYKAKKRRHIGKIFFRAIFLVALAFGAYYLARTYILSNRHAYSYEEAVDFYVKAVNEDDISYMTGIIPKYLDDREEEAESILNNTASLHINSYTIDDKYMLEDSEIYELRDAIKLQTSKTAKVTTAYKLKVTFNVDVDAGSKTLPGGSNLYITMDMDFIEINNKWYLQVGSYDNIDYN